MLKFIRSVAFKGEVFLHIHVKRKCGNVVPLIIYTLNFFRDKSETLLPQLPQLPRYHNYHNYHTKYFKITEIRETERLGLVKKVKSDKLYFSEPQIYGVNFLGFEP